jgi:hypothetical protein
MQLVAPAVPLRSPLAVSYRTRIARSGSGAGEASGRRPLAWQRFSVRTGVVQDDGPYEDVPGHLYEPLVEWINYNFGGRPNSPADVEGGPRLAAAMRRVIPHGDGPLTVRAVTGSISHFDTDDKLLDAVDAALYLKAVTVGARRSLDELLMLGGSVWRVDPDGRRLIRRVDETAVSAFEAASSPDDAASTELREAWATAYGRNPNASDAWDHSIKAVEAALIPIVTPSQARATLGNVVGILDSQGSQWQLDLHGHDNSQSVGPLVSMLRLMWPNPDRHGSRTSRTPSLTEAQEVVHLAVTLVQWARCDAIVKRT